MIKKIKKKSSEKGYSIIEPPKGLVKIDFKEMWAYRDLLFILIWRNIAIRYKQTAVGVSWAIFQPVVTMTIFTIFFGRLAKIPSENIPYPVFVFAGLLYWNYFSAALTAASDSLVEDESIIKKVYFPRMIVPISTAVTPIIDFALSFVVLFVVMAIFHFRPNFWGILFIPVLVLITTITSSGLGLFLSSLNAKYRDVRYILGFFIQIMLFVTPIIYPASLIPPQYKWIIFLNPMSGVITVARDTLLHHADIDWKMLGVSFGLSLVFLILGLGYFRKTERFFADVL